MPMIIDPRKKSKWTSDLGSALGDFYRKARGVNPFGSLSAFGKQFRNAADIPENAKLWDWKSGIQLGKLPVNIHEPNFAINPNAIGLDASKNFGGLGATYNFAADSPFASLNGLDRQKIIDAISANNVNPAIDGTALSTEQLNALNKLGDIDITRGNVVGQSAGGKFGLGDLSNVINLGVQGIRAGKGMAENAQADTDYRSLIKDIKSSAYANPMASQYLTADQNRLLRQARTGGLDVGNWGGAAQGAVQGIPQALLSALLGGATGGIGGALIGGLGSLGNSAIQGYGNRTREQNDRLSGLYSALQNAEAAYRDESNRRIRNRHFNYMY